MAILDDDYDSDYEEEDVYNAPRDMVTAVNEFTNLQLSGAETLDKYLSCPVCLSVMNQPTATECLHRFCSGCIETALRIGKKECPSCRFPIATRRALRRDRNFEALIRTLYPNGPPESDDEIDVGNYCFVPLSVPDKEEEQRAHQVQVQMQMHKDKAAPIMKDRKDKARSLPVQGNSCGVPSERKVRKGRSQLPRDVSDMGQPSHMGSGALVEEPKTRWSCPQCTLINSAAARKCKICDAPNPVGRASRTRKERLTLATTSAFREFEYAQCGESLSGADHSSGQAVTGAAGDSCMRSKPTLTPGEVRKGKGGRAAEDRESSHSTKRAKGADDVESEKRQREERYAARKEARAEESLRNAVQPEPQLDFSDEAPSIEAQLLARHSFSLHIKTVDASGVVVLWSFPTANPGDCSAWVSLAPAALVTEASARAKFKLITKNRMFGECRCRKRFHELT